MVARLLLLSMLLVLPVRAIEISRQAADELLAAIGPDDPWEKTKDASQFAWGESYTLHGLVDMYEATGDAKYLDELVRRGDRVLSHRDDRRGVADSSGKVHRRWSVGTKYTVAEATLVDSNDQPSIVLRSTLFAYNNLTNATVISDEKSFTIELTNRHWKRNERFSDVSMDPASERYFARVINDPKPRFRPITSPGECSEASQLVVAKAASDGARDAAKEAAGAPKSQEVRLTPLLHAHVGYVGIIYHPLLRFARLVRDEDALRERFGDAADRFVSEAQASYEEMSPHFRDGPGEGEGHYFGCMPGGAAPYDGVGYPFNYLGKLVSSELLLFELTGQPIHRERCEKIATLFHRRLELQPGECYVWDYWYEPVTTGWTAADEVSLNTPNHGAWKHVDDVSHAALEVEMAVNLAAAGVVFTDEDLKRLANTFVHNVINAERSGFNASVDGRIDRSGQYAATRVAGWLPLAGADRRVYEVAREVYLKRQKADFLSAACLLKWEKRLGGAAR